MNIIQFNDSYKDIPPDKQIILVKSHTNPNIIYQIRLNGECSCPAYSRFSAPWFADKKGLGPDYICKHMKKLINLQLPIENMKAVIQATNGDLNAFLDNWSWTKLNILRFQQNIILTKDNKIIWLE